MSWLWAEWLLMASFPRKASQLTVTPPPPPHTPHVSLGPMAMESGCAVAAHLIRRLYPQKEQIG